MPIQLPSGLRRFNQKEFATIAYEVMNVVFAVHNEMGGLFDEVIYKRAIAQRIPGSRAEVALEVCFDTFQKSYFMDLLVADGAPFELKAVDQIVERHRSQFLNYLLVAELPHGKLVNLRGESVTHEFLNAQLTRKDRNSFDVHDQDYSEIECHGFNLKELLIAMLRDWGTCLDVELYEDAVLYFLGGEDKSLRSVEISSDQGPIGHQNLNLICPETGLCITALNHGFTSYEGQLRRFVSHTSLNAIQWVNIGRKLVSFKTLKTGKCNA